MSKRKRRKKKKKKKPLKEFKVKGREKVTNKNDTVFVPGIGVIDQPMGCHTVVNKKDDEWETDLEVVKECGKFKADTNGKVVVWLEPLAKVKIDALMEEYKAREWLGYLLGDKEKMLVKDIFIPEQNATSTRVDEIECEEFNDLPVMGVIHSHHNMGTNFSGTDHAYINQNHDISLLVAHSGIAGQVRKKVPCGAFLVTDVKVRLALKVDWKKEEWIKEITKKIKKPVYAYQPQVGRQVQHSQPRQHGSGYWFNGAWHPSHPQVSEKSVEDGSWTCSHCFTVNVNSKAKTCHNCLNARAETMLKRWLCTECYQPNYNLSATICAYCRKNRFPTKAEENQFILEREWSKWEREEEDEKKEEKKGKGWVSVKNDDNEWSSGISEKNLGTYMCGRCNKTWENVDLRKFTKCPDCDKVKSSKEEEKIITTESFRCKECNIVWEIPVGDHLQCPACDEDDNLIEDLKKDLDSNFSCAACETEHNTLEEARQCCNEDNNYLSDDYKCEICGVETNFPNTIHAKCMVEKNKKEPVV